MSIEIEQRPVNWKTPFDIRTRGYARMSWGQQLSHKQAGDREGARRGLVCVAEWLEGDDLWRQFREAQS